MKGIILETKGSCASVMTEDGAFCKVRNHDYRIGEEIIMKKEGYSRPMLIRLGAGVAAVFALFILSAFAYFTPTGYVSLDVNPSIEYSINMFNRVLQVKAVNEDAVKLLGVVDFKNMTIDEALEQTTAKLIEKGYITDTETNDIYITTTGKNTKKSEKLAEQLESTVRQYVGREDKAAEVEAEAIGRARVEMARDLQEKVDELEERGKLPEPIKVTPGKLNLVQKLIDSDTDGDYIEIVTDEAIIDWIGKPVKEIQSAIKDSRGKGKLKEEDSQENSDNDDEKVKPGKGNTGDKAEKKEDKKEAQQKKKENKETNKNSEGNKGENSKETGKQTGKPTKPEKTAEDKEDDTKDTEDPNGNNKSVQKGKGS